MVLNDFGAIEIAPQRNARLIEGGAPGIHFCTLSQSALALEIAGGSVCSEPPARSSGAPAGNATFRPSRPAALPPLSIAAIATAASRSISIICSASAPRLAGSVSSLICSANPALLMLTTCSLPLATGRDALPSAPVVALPAAELPRPVYASVPVVVFFPAPGPFGRPVLRLGTPFNTDRNALSVMACSATTPARSNSLFLVGRFRLVARSLRPSSTSYSALGMVKLSLTSFCRALEGAGVDPALPFEAEAFDVAPGRFGTRATRVAAFAVSRAFLANFAFVILLTSSFYTVYIVYIECSASLSGLKEPSMQAVNSQAGYALMDPAFVREVAGDPGVASATLTPAGRASRAPWRAWYGETAARLSAFATGIAKGHRGPTSRE